MPNGRRKHGANGNKVDPKSSVGHQQKNRYGEVLPDTKPYKQTTKMPTADPNTKEWQDVAPGNPLKKEFVRKA